MARYGCFFGNKQTVTTKLIHLWSEVVVVISGALEWGRVLCINNKLLYKISLSRSHALYLMITSQLRCNLFIYLSLNLLPNMFMSQGHIQYEVRKCKMYTTCIFKSFFCIQNWENWDKYWTIMNKVHIVHHLFAEKWTTIKYRWGSPYKFKNATDCQAFVDTQGALMTAWTYWQYTIIRDKSVTNCHSLQIGDG